MIVQGEETAVQALVGSIVRAFRRLKKPRIRELSARGYALHSVRPHHSFSSSTVDGVIVWELVFSGCWDLIIRCLLIEQRHPAESEKNTTLPGNNPEI